MARPAGSALGLTVLFVAPQAVATKRQDTVPCFQQGKVHCVNALSSSVRKMFGFKVLQNQLQAWFHGLFFFLIFWFFRGGARSAVSTGNKV